MKRLIPAILSLVTIVGTCQADVTQVLNRENQELGVSKKALPVVDDLSFLRRVYVDLIGRIPTQDEIDAFAKIPRKTRRADLVDQLLANERFADRWTTFFADLLRLRYNADGGAAAIAFVNQAINDGMSYDEMSRRFISANGKAGAIPEVGFVLGDNADPMALAGVTAQTFMGIRIACAQCHDHPFDKWTRHDFYGLAAYFGKTRRIETRFTNTVYTTEVAQTSILWPPQGAEGDEKRKPMSPIFPVKLLKGDGPSKYIARLNDFRKKKAQAAGKVKKDNSDDALDALLADADEKVKKRTKGSRLGGFDIDVTKQAKADVRKIDLRSSMFSASELRTELAAMITSPRNRYFSRCFANRVWAELVGRGIVEPVDDFSDENQPSHPKTLDYLADEFVASGFDLRSLIRMVVTSDAYQRAHANDVDEATQQELEESFLATPLRRMLSETLFDSIVTAGHLFDVKHAAGKNMKITWVRNRIAKDPEDNALQPDSLNLAAAGDKKKMPVKEKKAALAQGYDLERAIELDFKKLLAKKDSKEPDQAAVEKMRVMSKEEIEAMRMQEEMQQQRRYIEYIDRFVRREVDDNPKFSSTYLMASPAIPEHFVRVFGQTDRTQLGATRDQSPSMRQALMIMNGRLTNEAARVGEFEPMHELLAGKTPNVQKAIQLAYREILTREPTKDEVTEAKQLIAEGESKLTGMADLRWLLLNCNEFRFLP